MGFVPLLLLSIAVVIGASVGLKLGQNPSSQAVADQLGCTHITQGLSATGVKQDACTYKGDRIIVWSFSRGLNTVEPVGWMRSGVEGPTWTIGCEHSEDCAAIHRRLGGQHLDSA
jgi:hypothetical protein